MHSFQKYHLRALPNILIPLMLCFTYLAHAAEDQISKAGIESENLQVKGNLPSSYFYLGGKLGINHYQHGCEAWSLDCDKNSFAAGILTGYQFNENFAMEAAYLDLGDAKAS